MKLSKNRTDAVKDFFVENAGIKALGQSNPVADNTTEEGRAKNRSVELIVFQNTNRKQKEVAGTWETIKRGDLRIYKYGDDIAGWYVNDEGEILGKMTSDHPMAGQWVINGSEKTCDTDNLWQKNWGSLVIEFNDDFTEFQGKCGYCDEEATKTGWDAKKK